MKRGKKWRKNVPQWNERNVKKWKYRKKRGRSGSDVVI